MTDGFTGKQFQTAARRRHGRALEFQIAGWDPETNVPVDVTLRVDPLVDMVIVGSAFGEFGKTLSGLSDSTADPVEKMQTIKSTLPKVRQVLREMIVPHDRAAWDLHGSSLDTQALGDLVQWVMRELSGMDPTQQASSQIGSPPTGLTSMDGAPLAG